MTISLKEAPILALRLQMQIEPYGIKLDAKKFEDMLREDNGKDIVCSDFV